MTGGGCTKANARRAPFSMVVPVLSIAFVFLVAAPDAPAVEALGQGAGNATTETRSDLAPRLYDVTTETGMPNLEENLRYAVVRQRRCLDPRDLSKAFWMLDDISLKDCRLENSRQDERESRYDLRCDGSHGASGRARWHIGAGQLRGTLDVKLGGKNMTFYQRVVATAVGECPAPGS